MKILLAASIAFGLCAIGADAAPSAAPDFSGLWVRPGNLWFEPLLEEGVGRPIGPMRVNSRDAEQIYAGNYNNPILQSWAREIVKANAESEIALKHVYTADDTCWPSGVPQSVNRPDRIEIVQVKDRVLIINQRDHQVRWIWLNQEHAANLKPSWYGESVGRFEGDTLVVDTIGQKAHRMSVVDPFGTPHTAQIHVVERYRPFSDPFGKGLEVIVLVDDPGAFTMPWKGQAVYRQDKSVDQLDEYVCAENNRTFGDKTTFGEIPVEEAPSF